MRYKVTFHDSHVASDPCECEAKADLIDATDPKSAAIKAFCAIDTVRDDPSFLPFAQNPSNWQSPVDGAFVLDTQESESWLYPVTAVKA